MKSHDAPSITVLPDTWVAHQKERTAYLPAKTGGHQRSEASGRTCETPARMTNT